MIRQEGGNQKGQDPGSQEKFMWYPLWTKLPSLPIFILNLLLMAYNKGIVSGFWRVAGPMNCEAKFQVQSVHFLGNGVADFFSDPCIKQRYIFKSTPSAFHWTVSIVLSKSTCLKFNLCTTSLQTTHFTLLLGILRFPLCITIVSRVYPFSVLNFHYLFLEPLLLVDWIIEVIL